MTAGKRVAVAIGGLLGVIVLFLALTRFWPFLLLSLLQHGEQGRMHCWVKVVDQDGRSVVGYQCRVVEHKVPFLPFLSERAGVRVYETKQDGTFEYVSKGAVSLVFFGYWDSQWALNPGHLMQRNNLGVYSLEIQQAIREKPIAYLGSKENPYLIHVFSVGRPQKLLYWKTRVKLKEMGDYLCVDLLSGKTWESKKPEGDVAVADGLFGQHGELPRCFISIVSGTNCSLYPVVDDWGLGPPKSGYVKELCCGKDWQEKRKGSYGPIQFYYRLENAEIGMDVYGRLTFGLSPRVDGALIESYTNLQGERNLFYKGYTDLMDQKILDFVSPPV